MKAEGPERRADRADPPTGPSADIPAIHDRVMVKAVSEPGYYVGRVEGNLYRVTDGSYQSAFLTTSDGVVLFDAPPSIGHNIQRAVDEIAAASGACNKVTHLVYSHHHADHAGASSLFGRDVTRIGHQETRNLLLRDDDPARPPPHETFQDRRSFDIGGERIELGWHGSNHSPDNIFIHLPDHASLMLVDIVNPGSAAVCQSYVAVDVPGYIQAADTALTYPWKHFIGGHIGRLGTRHDVATHRHYLADIAASARQALDTVDPTPFFAKHGRDTALAMKDYFRAATTTAAAPVIEKYIGVLADADAFTAAITFEVMRSARFDLGYGEQVHP